MTVIQSLEDLRGRGLDGPFVAVGRSVATGRMPAEQFERKLQVGLGTLKSKGYELSSEAVLELRHACEAERDEVPYPLEEVSFQAVVERLREVHEDDFLWTPQRRLNWDGRRWQLDNLTVGGGWVHSVAREMLDDAERLGFHARTLEQDKTSKVAVANLELHFGPRPRSGEGRRAWNKRVAAQLRFRSRSMKAVYRQVEKPRGLEQVLELAAIGHTIREEDLDAQDDSLNTASGTVDLRSGDLRPHDRRDRLTKLTGVEFRPGYRNGAWEEFLHSLSGGDQEWLQLLQLAVGYSAFSTTREKAFFLLLGPPHAGKTTFLDVVARALGDYAGPFDLKAFGRGHGAGGHEENIAALAGVRFLVSNEVGDELRVDGGQLKSWTSGDPRRVSRKGQPSFEMRPVGKLWLSCNRLPSMDLDDVALWDRCVVIPFEKTFARSDKREKLLEDPNVLAAALAWVVEGALRYSRRVAAGQPGWTIPARIQERVDRERGMQNPLTDFIRTECEVDAGAITPTADLYRSYQRFCAMNGEEPISQRKWGAFLRPLGLHPDTVGKARGWRGCRLLRQGSDGDKNGSGTAQRTASSRSSTSPTSGSQRSCPAEEMAR